MGGKVGMTISGHWAMPGFRGADERDSKAISLHDIGVVGLPQYRERATVIYESGWAVAKDSPNPELAVKLARYLSGPECQRRRSQMGLAVSANREVALEASAGNPRERVFYDEVQYGRAPWGTKISDWSVVEDLLSEGIERVILGYSTPADALNETAQLIDDELSMF
jgi:ABC-type glycerol-3-phosphate transport system substrate-binding protein